LQVINTLSIFGVHMITNLPATPTFKNPPQMPGLPLIGNALDFFKTEGMPVEALRQASQQQGDVMRVQVGARTMYVVADPVLIHEILVKRVQEFHKLSVLNQKPRGLDRFFRNGILTSDYPEWRPQHKIIQPLMHTKHIEGYAETMVRMGEQLLAGWRAGSTRDLHADMTQVTMWIIAETMFGMDIANTPQLQLAGRLGQAITVADTTRPLPEFLLGQRNRQAAKVNEIMSALVAQLMQERRANADSQQRSDLLTLLMQTTDEEGNPMPDEFVRNNILTLFFAGHETTANTLVWALHYLAQNPTVLATLHAEVDATLQGRAPTLTDLRKLPYTQMVIKETMRIEPTVAMIPRALTADTELGGYQLTKGSVVLIPPYIVHRDPRWWRAAEQFDPTRFSAENEPNIPKFAYLPFGGGPRICIGNHFALMEAQILLSMIVSRFELRHAPKATVVPLRQVTTHPQYGLPMTVQARRVP